MSAHPSSARKLIGVTHSPTLMSWCILPVWRTLPRKDPMPRRTKIPAHRRRRFAKVGRAMCLCGREAFRLSQLMPCGGRGVRRCVDRPRGPLPVTAYGRSKLAAEEAIKSVLADSDCATTILRPPLVYGPGNKANFGLLVKLVQAGIPLPLASVRNRRSFIYVENLVDLIGTCLGNPLAFGKTFYPSDVEDVSTPELIRAVSRANQSVQCSVRSDSAPSTATRHSSPATHHSPRLFPFPESVLEALGRLPGMRALRKLTSPLYVDSEPLRRDLGWSPPFTMVEGLGRTLGAPVSKLDQ